MDSYKEIIEKIKEAFADKDQRFIDVTLERILTELYDKAHDDGHSEGYDEGYENGFAEGETGND